MATPVGHRGASAPQNRGAPAAGPQHGALTLPTTSWEAPPRLPACTDAELAQLYGSGIWLNNRLLLRRLHSQSELPLLAALHNSCEAVDRPPAFFHSLLSPAALCLVLWDTGTNAASTAIGFVAGGQKSGSLPGWPADAGCISALVVAPNAQRRWCESALLHAATRLLRHVLHVSNIELDVPAPLVPDQQHFYEQHGYVVSTHLPRHFTVRGVATDSVRLVNSVAWQSNSAESHSAVAFPVESINMGSEHGGPAKSAPPPPLLLSAASSSATLISEPSTVTGMVAQQFHKLLKAVTGRDPLSDSEADQRRRLMEQNC